MDVLSVEVCRMLWFWEPCLAGSQWESAVWRAAEQAGVFAQSLKARSLCARGSVAAQRVSQAWIRHWRSCSGT